MCGRFTLTKRPEQVADHFGLGGAPAIEPRYNVALGRLVFALRAAGDGAREGVLLEWGLVPSWASDPSAGYKMLNARSETVKSKQAFRAACQRRRCLIPACGFYEWKSVGKQKLPVHFRMRDGGLFAFAGLWERWTSPEGAALESCTVITTVARGELVAGQHDHRGVSVPFLGARGDGPPPGGPPRSFWRVVVARARFAQRPLQQSLA
jgi:putative SOS response-associated peptidase YedK